MQTYYSRNPAIAAPGLLQDTSGTFLSKSSDGVNYLGCLTSWSGEHMGRAPAAAADVTTNRIGVVCWTSPQQSPHTGVLARHEDGSTMNIILQGNVWVLVNKAAIAINAPCHVLTAAAAGLPAGAFSDTGGTALPGARFISTPQRIMTPWSATTFNGENVTFETNATYFGYALVSLQ